MYCNCPLPAKKAPGDRGGVEQLQPILMARKIGTVGSNRRSMEGSNLMTLDMPANSCCCSSDYCGRQLRGD